MNLRSFAAFLLWISLRKFPLVCGQECREKTGMLEPSLSDRKFTTNVLFERDGVSKPRCAGLCMRTDQCATLTCTQTEGRLCQCRGYRGRRTPSDPYEESPRTKAYLFPVDGGLTPWTAWSPCSATCGPGTQTHTRTCTSPVPQFGGAACVGATSQTQACNLIVCDWLYKSCSGDADCSQPNSDCRNTKCMCNHGYYYSVSAKVCQEDCPPADLQDTYLHYENSKLVFFDFDTSVFRSSAWCKSKCDGDIACLYYEFVGLPSLGTCSIPNTNSRQLTLIFFLTGNHYQRNCA